MTASIFESTLTRRRALSGGLACVLAAFVPRRVFGALASESSPAAMTGGVLRGLINPNLYAFAGTAGDTTAIAVTWQELVGRAKMDCHSSSRLRIHAGLKTWEFDLRNQAFGKAQRSDGMRVFFGGVLPFSGRGDGSIRAVVIELPNLALRQNGAAGIWAEYNEEGQRQRIGTPILANLVAADQSLATIYHSSSPAEDRDLLARPLAEAIAARRAANGFSAGSVSRLASALLPDVLHYDSGRPAGFTFAAQNGRHPSERTDEVVNGLLIGRASSASSLPSAYLHVDSFPYFRLAQQSI